MKHKKGSSVSVQDYSLDKQRIHDLMQDRSASHVMEASSYLYKCQLQNMVAQSCMGRIG